MKSAAQQSRTYTTSELARIVNLHPNTIRKYEELRFITKPARKENGYRTFTDLQLLQVKLVRAAFRVELIQNNVRKEALEIIEASAQQKFDLCLELIKQRNEHLMHERVAAEHAITVASHYQEYQESKAESHNTKCMTRSDAAHYLSTTIDALRNWEMNGLLQVKRRQNGYRVYNGEDLNRLSLIRALRMANYSLASIKRLLDKLETNPASDIRAILNTPDADEDIVSACDRLIVSLDEAILASGEMTELVLQMKKSQ